MPTLRSLTEKIEVGDYFAWIAERARSGSGKRTTPKEVKDIEKNGNTIRVHARGVRGGEYYCDVEPDSSSRAYFVNGESGEHEPMGPLFFAELTDSDDLVRIREGFYDSRGESADD